MLRTRPWASRASTLGDGEGFTTLDLKISFVRPFWTGTLIATARGEGRAHDRTRRSRRGGH